MPETQKLLLVDTRALVSLAQAGSEGLNTLLAGGQPVILRDVRIEIDSPNTPLETRAVINDWIDANSSSIIQPDWRYPNLEGRTTQVADYAIRDFAQNAHVPEGSAYPSMAVKARGSDMIIDICAYCAKW